MLTMLVSRDCEESIVDKRPVFLDVDMEAVLHVFMLCGPAIETLRGTNSDLNQSDY